MDLSRNISQNNSGKDDNVLTPSVDDCFIKFGFVSSPEEKTDRLNKRNPKQQTSEAKSNENEQDQPAFIVEEINAITSLFIYDIFTKKQKLKLNPKQQTQTIMSSDSICDDIDRFDSVYSCLIDQNPSDDHPLKKSYRVQNHLRERFFTLPTINEFNDFQQSEQKRVYEEKQVAVNRIPFIPNIPLEQRRCPYYYHLNEREKESR